MNLELEIEDFDVLFRDVVVDPASITLTKDDIDDPCINVDMDKFATYNLNHLKQWLIYRGDLLHNINTLKSAQIRVLQYIENGTDKSIVDPTPQKFWLRKKADSQGLILSPFWKDGTLPSVPNELKNELTNPQELTGWSKSLHGMPNFTVDHIKTYHEKITNLFCEKSTAIKKHFIRGEQFIEEKFIDLSNTYVRESNEVFFVKGISAASMKKTNRWMFLALRKVNGEIVYCYCQCPAGKAGTCSHSYALMKSVAKWVIDRLAMVPEDKPCTSRPCVWNIPQAKDRMEKVPIVDLTFVSPNAKRRKSDTSSESISKGIVSSLYNPCTDNLVTQNDLSHILDIINMPPDVPAPRLINETPTHFKETLFGKVPVGSILSYHCPFIPPDFTVYCSINETQFSNQQLFLYPEFPFLRPKDEITKFKKDIHFVEIKKKTLLYKLEVESTKINEIEESTRTQADDPKWFLYRKHRFTASLCNKLIGKGAPKTDRGLGTLAHNIVFGSSQILSNNVVKMKMEHGRYFEPIAINNYEKYMKLKGFNILVESCGLVVDSVNYVLGATPDGKVICNGEYGILEVKCPEQYRDVDPKTICLISPNPCIVLEKETNLIRLSKTHSYYGQVQMQLALTCQTWCDFVLYTSKGLVVDRVYFDEPFWKTLQNKILEFYFYFQLPEIVDSYENADDMYM